MLFETMDLPPSLIAEVDGEVVGHIMFSTITIHTEKHAVESLSLAPMAVLPRFQRQGIGSALIEGGIEGAASYRMAAFWFSVIPEVLFSIRLFVQPRFQLICPFGRGEAWMALELVPESLKGSQRHGRILKSSI